MPSPLCRRRRWLRPLRRALRRRRARVRQRHRQHLPRNSSETDSAHETKPGLKLAFRPFLEMIAMLKYRFAISIVALATCQWAQAAGDVRTPVGTGDAKVVTNITTAQEKAATEPAGVQPQTEPRIIRGNDLVIAAPKAGKGIEGAASAFKFEDAPISEVVHTIMREIIKVDYVLHQPVTGSVTLATRAEVSPDQAVFLLESALQANGLLMARDSRGIYHVGRPEALKGIVAAPRQSGRGPLPQAMEPSLFHCNTLVLPRWPRYCAP